jgi:hypothetical protein
MRRPGPISLAASFTSDVMSSPELITSPRRTNSPSPISSSQSHFPEQRPQHRRVMSTPTACSKLRIADKICPRNNKAGEAKPKPKPARTQPYGPPYNWTPPTPGAWAVAEGEAEEADEDQETIARQLNRVSAPAEPPSSRNFTRHEPDRSGDVAILNPAVQ